MLDAAIVGAGFGGLCAAIKLREQGFVNIAILERSAEVGGTWRDNVYPGCACDVPSHLYSFSFEPNTRWTRPYPQQPEIQDYVLRTTEKQKLRPLIRFGCHVQVLHWQAEEACWRVDVAGQEPVLARHVILATGPLNKPLIPALPGLDTFPGPMFHSSHWRHDIDLKGKRIAVVGTGASAVQFVPEIAPDAARLTVFQRTAAWVLPRWDQPYGKLRTWAYRHVPGLQRLSRWRVYWFNELVGMGFMGHKAMQRLLMRLSDHHLHKQVAAPALRAALTPTFAPGCKRLLISNTWFPTLLRPNVELVTHAVSRVTPEGVVSADGALHPCDVIIWGTGFQASEFVAPMKVHGESGELGEQWKERPAETRLGITVAGFPNLFLLVGPSTGLGHNSIIFMIECQVRYVVQALKTSRAKGFAPLRLKPAVQQGEYQQIQHAMQRTVWVSGCKSWYQNASGQIDTLWPGYTWQYWLKTRRFQMADYL